jgi:hypothetical protein
MGTRSTYPRTSVLDLRKEWSMEAISTAPGAAGHHGWMSLELPLPLSALPDPDVPPIKTPQSSPPGTYDTTAEDPAGAGPNPSTKTPPPIKNEADVYSILPES